MAIKDYIKNEEKYLIELRRYFHEHPEESLKEFNTCKKIEEELDKAVKIRASGCSSTASIVRCWYLKVKNYENAIVRTDKNDCPVKKP